MTCAPATALTVDGHDETTVEATGADPDGGDEDRRVAVGAPAVPGGPDQTPAGELDLHLDVDRWAELARTVLAGEGVAAGHLDLIFVDPEPMAALNREYLGHEGPTDVLAFPLDGPTALVAGAEGGPPAHLGDVVICPAVAARQAPAHAGTLEAELALLVVHGVLHVLGHDHAQPDEAEAMRDRERVHLAGLGFDHPVGEGRVGEGR